MCCSQASYQFLLGSLIISFGNSVEPDVTVRSREGPYLWERDCWSGSVINTCGLVTELTGSPKGPVMDKVINGCPLDKCLSYGKYHRSDEPYPILENQAIEEISDIINNAEVIQNIKSMCYRLTGVSKVTKEMDNSTTVCQKTPHWSSPCCSGEFHVQGSITLDTDTHQKCVACMPHFYSIGPEKTGSTDLYNRISLLQGVIPSHNKETAWWTEGIRFENNRHRSLAGYMLRYFKHLGAKIDQVDRERSTAIGVPIDGSNSINDVHNFDYITGEATPAMFNYQHHGLSLVPRWIRCIYPQAKIIITLRNPIDRAYSDFHFFGKLQATKGTYESDIEKKELLLKGLSPEGFHAAMQVEVRELRSCFENRNDKLLFTAEKKACNYIRVDQMEKLGFQSKRIPGRLLLSLYPMHMALWLRYFPCEQVLVLRSEGTWTEQTMVEVAKFLGVDPASAKKAAAAESIRPEQFAFNKEANELDVSKKHEDMLSSTRILLAEFFEDHWLARFPEVSEQLHPETCDTL